MNDRPGRPSKEREQSKKGETLILKIYLFVVEPFSPHPASRFSPAFFHPRVPTYPHEVKRKVNSCSLADHALFVLTSGFKRWLYHFYVLSTREGHLRFFLLV